MSCPDVSRSDHAPLAALLQEELQRLQHSLAAAAGSDGVLVDATDLPPPATRHLWLHLRCDPDFRSLPVASDDADVVVLRHALDTSPQPLALLDEAIRVLAPGGVLVILGMRRCSAWWPWLAWRARRGAPAWRAQAPRRWLAGLANAGVAVDALERFGSPWPGRGGDGGPFAAAYLLRGSKRRAAPRLVGRIEAARREFHRLPSLAGAARRARA